MNKTISTPSKPSKGWCLSSQNYFQREKRKKTHQSDEKRCSIVHFFLRGLIFVCWPAFISPVQFTSHLFLRHPHFHNILARGLKWIHPLNWVSEFYDNFCSHSDHASVYLRRKKKNILHSRYGRKEERPTWNSNEGGNSSSDLRHQLLVCEDDDDDPSHSVVVSIYFMPTKMTTRGMRMSNPASTKHAYKTA